MHTCTANRDTGQSASSAAEQPSQVDYAQQKQKVSRIATRVAKKNNDSSANLGFEAKLWLAADKLRNNMDAGGGYKHEGLKYYDGEYREKPFLKPGDMIVTNTEQGFDHLLIGHAAIVPTCYGPKGLYSHHIYRVRQKPSSPFSPHYLVELFNNRRWHYWISGFSNGTTINMLPKDALEMPMLVVPPPELVAKFTSLAEAAHLKIEVNKQESRTLAALRDTLLPKLLSGKLSVRSDTPEAETI